MRFFLQSVLIVTVCVASITTAGIAHAQEWKKVLQGTVDAVVNPSNTSSMPLSVGGLSTDDIVSGLKEALRVGAETVAGQLGVVDGFNADPKIHIPLPKELQSVQATLRRVGLSSLADEIELKLNRGAEAAMPQAKALVLQAISSMTLEDARVIYNGPDDAATQYFKRVASADLEASVSPVIETALQDVGAVAAYDQLIGQYRSIPFVPDLKADLTAHATALTLDGLFHYLAVEEAGIRQDPAKRTTEILTKVFGGKKG